LEVNTPFNNLRTGLIAMLIVFKNISTPIETSKLGLIHKVNNKRRKGNIHTSTSPAEILHCKLFLSQKNYYVAHTQIIFHLIVWYSYLELVLEGKGREEKGRSKLCTLFSEGERNINYIPIF